MTKSFDFLITVLGFKGTYYCDTMWSLCYVCASRTISLPILALNPNKGLELEISRKTGNGRGEESPREARG